MTFAEHKEKTADDCLAVAGLIKDVAEAVHNGNMTAFEQFFHSGGTEEGDAKLLAMVEILLLRYYHRDELVNGPVKPEPESTTKV